MNTLQHPGVSVKNTHTDSRYVLNRKLPTQKLHTIIFGYTQSKNST